MKGKMQIGSWTVEPSLHRIDDGAESRRLGPKVMAVLCHLAERPGEVVSKQQLIDRVWEGAFTSDEALSAVIYELRKALGDDARRPTYVETIRKGGYRLVAPVTAMTPPDLGVEATPSAGIPSSPSAPWSIAAAVLVAVLAVVALAIVGWTALERGAGRSPMAAPVAVADGGVRSVAVLPLAAFTEACTEDFLAQGLTEMLAADIARLSPLEVTPEILLRSDGEAWDLHRAARELAVDAVVEGSLVRSEERLWLSVQLISTADGRVLWGGTYERDLDDAFLLQRELAMDIAWQVSATVSPQADLRLARREPAPPAAEEAVEKGRYFLAQSTSEGARKAVTYFEKAVALAPRLPEAHVGLADSVLASAARGTAAERRRAYERAVEAVDAAFDLRGDWQQAHLSRGELSFRYEWDWQRAEDHFQRGFAPDQCTVEDGQRYAEFLSAMGRHDEAIATLRLALARRPVSRRGYEALAWLFFMARQYDEALRALDAAQELAPEAPAMHRLRGEVLLAAGREKDAVRAQQRALELGGEPPAAEEIAQAFAQDGVDGVYRWRLERQSAAGAADPVELAGLSARLGEVDEALAWLSRAYDERRQQMVWLKVDPALDPLRQEPRFQELLARMDLGS